MMQRDESEDRRESASDAQPRQPDDGELVARLRDGDADALRALMARYDRLVRYAVFRLCRTECVQDPTFLDARASEAWTGFVRSVQRTDSALPENLKTYLIQITRNKCADASRSAEPAGVGDAGDVASDLSLVEAPGVASIELLIQAEEVLALRDCLDHLTSSDKRIYGQLEHLVAKRWKVVAQVLDMPESTVRSRWSAIIAKLRACLEKKTSKNFAPPPTSNDS